MGFSKRILIVDDSTVLRNGLRSLLERHSGWLVCGEAVNGQDGLNKARELHPDIVVLDLSMPVMDGLEAAKHLSVISPCTPVVLFTNYDCPQAKTRSDCCRHR
jgi:DNA-binding NarL/FixJ family response regulator